jgi:hypothetical protein
VLVYAAIIFLALLKIAFEPMGSQRPGRHNAAMQQVRQIGQLLYSYSVDNTANGNAFPDGKSSTEIFQKLMDGGYLFDPSLLYLPLPGKVKAGPNQKELRPENVCFDVTEGVDPKSSDFVPLVFMTGYRIQYMAGGSATPLIKPYPPYWSVRAELESWDTQPTPDQKPGMAVHYKGNNAVYLILSSDKIIPNVISSAFKPDGHTYRQLTPDGVLPP